MQFVNLTPHEIGIRIRMSDIILPSAGLARVSTTEEQVGDVDGIPLVRTTYGEVSGLPDPADGVIYIVSAVVLDAAKRAGRTDVVAPDSGPSAIRNDKGHIVAVRQLRVG